GEPGCGTGPRKALGDQYLSASSDDIADLLAPSLQFDEEGRDPPEKSNESATTGTTRCRADVESFLLERARAVGFVLGAPRLWLFKDEKARFHVREVEPA